MESEALGAPGKPVEQVSRQLDIFRNEFHDPNACISSYLERASLVAQLVKNLPAMQETWA